MFVCRNHAKGLFKFAKWAKNGSSAGTDRYLHITALYRCKHKKDPPNEEEISGSVSSKYEVFVDYKSPIIFDIEQEREKFYEVTDESDVARRKVRQFEEISKSRGERGVFDIHELVAMLKREKVIDMVVLKIPEEYAYVDYFVIISCKSWKQMRAVAEYVRRAWKYKTDGKGFIPSVEGENSKSWKALDLGNIALHIMSQSAREMYDLESLWSVGSKYDIKSNLDDEVTDYSYESVLSKLMPASK